MSAVTQHRVPQIDLGNPWIAEVWGQLDKVCDPELDEPITDMGFVEAVDIDADRNVSIRFRLPTYWCSPNFAFLMATDIRLSVEKLEWVSKASVRLEDHMFDEQVNVGVNEGRSFQEIFADLAPDHGLDEIREKFRKKAFQRRQEVMLLGLRKLGFSDAQIVGMTLEQFDAVRFTDDEEIRQQKRYRDIASSIVLANAPEDRAFNTYGAEALEAQGLDEYLGILRGVRINMEFSGALCRGLLSTRYKELNKSTDGPSLVDFILDRVPPKGAEEGGPVV